MSAKDLQPSKKGNDQQNNTQNAVRRRSQPTLNMSPPRCSSAKPYHASEGRRHVRSHSESFCSLGTLRRSSSQELCCSTTRQEGWKLPKIPLQRVKSDDLTEVAPKTATVFQRRSSCVLSDFSKGMSAKDLQPSRKGNDQQNNTQNAVRRRSQPTLNMSPPRCNSAKPYHASEGRRHVRSHSESFCLLGTLRSSSFQELCCSTSGHEEWKLPKIPLQRVKSDDLTEVAPKTATVLQRRSSCVLSDFSKGISANDLQPSKKGNDQQNNTQNAVRRRARSGSQPTLYMSPPRCNPAKPYHASEGRRLVRSYSESICSLGTLRSSSSQELCCSTTRQEEWKLPKIPLQRVKSDDLMEVAPKTATVFQRRSSCVLPDFSKGQEKAEFRAIPLRQEHVEKISSNFDSLESKSQNLAKWLQDQP